MGVEENKAALKRYYDEIMNKGNFSLLADLVDEEYYLESPTTKSEKGLEDFKKRYADRIAVSSDGFFTIDEMVAEGDIVVIRGYMKGTHTGDAPEMPATGKPYNAAYTAFYYFKNGKIVKGWTIHDVLTRFQQLGITPPSASAGS